VVVVHGLDSGTVVLSGGTEIIAPDGTARGARVDSGGREVLYAHGAASNVTVSPAASYC